MRLANRTPRFQSIEGGVIVAHSQKIFDFESLGTSMEQKYRFNMNPRSLGWIAEVSEHFQHFVIREMVYRYVGTCSTGAGARVTMAPYYEPQVPTGLMDNPNAFKDFVRDLPGVKEFAAWVSDAVGVAVSQFSRLVFRTVGLTSYRPRSVDSSNGDDIESVQPGQLLVSIFSGAVADDAPIGELWCDYVVELRGARPKTSAAVQFLSTSTDDAALALHTGSVVGDSSIARATGTNTIEVQRKGTYTLIIKRVGTNPVEDIAGLSILDQQNNQQRSARLLDVISSGVFTATDTGDDFTLDVGSATEFVSVVFLRLELGDQIIIEALTSGTITSTAICLYAGAPDIYWIS
jgi:hypothetical protein